MSDVKVNVKGGRVPVTRKFRADSKLSQFEAREFVEVTRTTDGQRMCEIRPGMLAYAIRGGEDQPIATLLADPGKLSIVYISEFITPLRNGHAGKPFPSGSDRADALVLRVREAQFLLTPKGLKTTALRPDDLIVGDLPYYMSIDSLLAPVPAVVGKRDPTGARRFLARVATEANECLKQYKGDLVDVVGAGVLGSFPDVTHFLSPHHLAPGDDTPPEVTAVAAASSERKKREFDDISGDDIVGFVVAEAESPPVVVPVVVPVAVPVASSSALMTAMPVVERCKTALVSALLEDQSIDFLAHLPDHLEEPFVNIVARLALADLFPADGAPQSALQKLTKKRRVELRR